MPHAALTVAQRESLYAGMIAGTFPAALLGELTAQAAARGVEQGTWLAQIISLCDVPLDELLSRQHSAAEALLATRVLAAAREEAVRIASAAYPAQTTVPAARPRRTGRATMRLPRCSDASSIWARASAPRRALMRAQGTWLRG